SMVCLTFLMPCSLNVASTTNVAIGTSVFLGPPADSLTLLCLCATDIHEYPCRSTSRMPLETRLNGGAAISVCFMRDSFVAVCEPACVLVTRSGLGAWHSLRNAALLQT